jgi:2-keto-4-pentenoate hydratase
LETTLEEKMDEISGVQATEGQKNMAEGHARVEEVTAADARTFSTEKVEMSLREGEDRTSWKVRPPPKRKKETQKTAGESE